jgi:hypothetical protein
LDDPDWRAKLAILERVFPDEFSRPKDREHAPENEKSLQVNYFFEADKTPAQLFNFPHIKETEPTPLPDSDDDVDVDDVDDDLNG